MRYHYLALLAAGSTVLAGCSAGGSGNAQSAPPAITISAADFKFEVPARVESGVTTIRLENHGTELHHMQIVKLEDGKTLEDLMAAIAAGGEPPAWAVAMGGPNAVEPGGVRSVVQNLEPGRYGLFCWIPSNDGVPHVMKGMQATMEVVPSSTPLAQEPEADIVMTLVDYGFQLSRPITAGQKVIRVENAGPQPHEVVIARLEPGKTVADLIAWEMGGRPGTPPGELVGGVVGLSPNQHTTFALDFQPGEYGFICFWPDVKDGQPHIAHGMTQQFSVN